MLMGVTEEDPALPVERPIRPHREGIGRMVGISGADPLEKANPHVCDVISVGVLEEQDIRLGGHQDATIPEFKARRVVHPGKGNALVGHPVPVLIGQDEESVVHLLQGFPLGIGRPCGRPEPAPGVHRHLHRVDQLGKLHLVGEALHPQARRQGHRLHLLLLHLCR